MSSLNKRFIAVGEGEKTRAIASIQRSGEAPGLFWLSGFRSVMSGEKATALDHFGEKRGLAVTRFDYSGLGESGGEFDQGTMSVWLEEALAVFATTSGPQIVVGSSMGGWLALLLAKHMLAMGTPLKGLVLIAPAVDATQCLIEPNLSDADRLALAENGYVSRESAYGDGQYRYTRALIEDGRSHALFGKAIETGCPVHILQGGQDRDVPRQHAEKLVTHILHDPVTFTLIPDGDHRLSRPEDLARMFCAIEAMI